MRPQQQNRRMRGRNNNNNNNNNNRKGPNPLTRSYESNGPDVKIRGSAQQIAEKYTTLARDAMSSGDRVMAENYLQHAEHYNRIIAAAQAQMPIQHQQNGPREESDEEMDDERDEFDGIGLPQYGYGSQNQQRQDNQPRQDQQRQGGGQPYQGGNGQGGNQQPRGGNNGGENGQGYERGGNGAPVNHAEAPQPVIQGMPAELALNGEQPGRAEGRGEFRDRRDRRRDRERRFDRDNREGGEQRAAQAEQREDEAQPELPSFVTQPISRREAPAVQDVVTANEASEAAQPVESVAGEAPAAEGDGAPRRGRRPRRSTRGQGDEAAQPAAEPETSPAPAES